MKDKSIPKLIHYCWFGKGDKSPLILKCMKSWKRFMPDYEIIEWNEDNVVLDNEYAKEAFEVKKYAFVSDYVRLKVIYEYGGIYLDTDVEVLKSLEPLLKDGGYIGFEHENTVTSGGGFAATPHEPAVKAMLDAYMDIHFIKDGQMDLTPCPFRNTESLKKLGLIPNNKKQKIGGIIAYPISFFSPKDCDSGIITLTKDTYTIHHYGYSWADEKSREVQKRKEQIFKLCPRFCAQQVFNVVNHIYKLFGK